MSGTIEPLLIDMLEWIAKEERSYAEVMEAWRTSCPHLPVWEEANERGLITRELHNGLAKIAVTKKGHALLAARKISA